MGANAKKHRLRLEGVKSHFAVVLYRLQLAAIFYPPIQALFGHPQQVGELDEVGALADRVLDLLNRRNDLAVKVFLAFRGGQVKAFLTALEVIVDHATGRDRKSTRLNSSHLGISYAVF